MKKVNLRDIPEVSQASPKGKFARTVKDISVALGRRPESTDLLERHPFDVQLCRVPPGKSRCPYHAHSAQTEFFHVLSGTGSVRHKDGATPVGPGDTFLFLPGEPHQLTNDGSVDLEYLVVADNPIGEVCHYPDSGKWLITHGKGIIVRSAPLDYFDGEE